MFFCNRQSSGEKGGTHKQARREHPPTQHARATHPHTHTHTYTHGTHIPQHSHMPTHITHTTAHPQLAAMYHGCPCTMHHAPGTWHLPTRTARALIARGCQLHHGCPAATHSHMRQGSHKWAGCYKCQSSSSSKSSLPLMAAPHSFMLCACVPASMCNMQKGCWHGVCMASSLDGASAPSWNASGPCKAKHKNLCKYILTSLPSAW